MLLQKSSSVPTIAGSEPQGALRPHQLIPTYIPRKIYYIYVTLRLRGESGDSYYLCQSPALALAGGAF